MSYKKKKIKKSRFNQLKYKLRLIKVVLLKQTTSFRVVLRSINTKAKNLFQSIQQKEGKPVFKLEKVVEVLQRYDRLSNNPDADQLEKTVLGQLEKDGLLKLCVFACPKFNPDALLSKFPENYMPIEAGPDLFEPRIQKVQAIRRGLMRAGLPTEVNVIIGDNDAEEYIFPLMNSITLNPEIYKQRQIDYRLSFEQRCQKVFGDRGCAVWSLAEMEVAIDKTVPEISESAMQKESVFFKWLFGDSGIYPKNLIFQEDVLKEMVRLKYGLYGAQGKFLEMLGGILLQTEGPGVWLERTAMLRSTGSPAIPAIYPWIRKDELIN